ncbi:LIRP protein, partial [Pseudoatta argentina]
MRHRFTTLAIVVAIIIVIKSHLLCPRLRSASSFEKECQTVILPRVIEKSSCDPAFYLNMSANRLNVLVTLLLAVALLVTESGNAQVDGYPQFSSKRSAVSAPQKYCGKKLSNALQIICDGVYNSMFKKSGQAREEANVDSRDSNFDYVRTQEMEMADYPIAYEFPPFLPRARARGMLDGRFAGRRYRRQGRGIHEECCINPCTISELTSYCGGRGSASE